MSGGLTEKTSRGAGRCYLTVSALLAVLLASATSLVVHAQPGEGTGAYAPDYARSWNMRSHDPRRTGRSPVRGARIGNRVWEHIASNGYAINMEPTVTQEGVFFGTWGVVRRLGARKTKWDKMDGKIYGLDRMNGGPLWSPIHPGVTKFAYKYKGRRPTRQDIQAGVGHHLNFYNGTVEGTGAVDPVTGNIYFGRGDGKLYAINPKTGKVVWKFETLDPARPDDPEGGGEIVGGPLVTQDGLIVFGTFAAPPKHRPPAKIRHETNALYAVDRQGKMVWRFPKKGSLGNAISAPPALSPDGSRVYAVSALLDDKEDCDLLCVQRHSGKLIWRQTYKKVGGQDLAVGVDGTIYVAGMGMRAVFGSLWLPVAFAVRDEGNRATNLWGPVMVDGEQPRSHMAGGLALFEDDGKVVDVFVSTTIIRTSNSPGGRLHRLDPATGEITNTWNPSEATPSCLGGLTDISLDNERTIYVGVRGRKKGFTAKETKGVMYALQLIDGKFKVLWSFQAEHNIDWASPGIGPDGGIYFGSTDVFGPGDVLKNYTNPKPPEQDLRHADPVFYGVLDYHDTEVDQDEKQ